MNTFKDFIAGMITCFDEDMKKTGEENNENNSRHKTITQKINIKLRKTKSAIKLKIKSSECKT